jgi:sec-independent protein translocase protein TatA
MHRRALGTGERLAGRHSSPSRIQDWRGPVQSAESVGAFDTTGLVEIGYQELSFEQVLAMPGGAIVRFRRSRSVGCVSFFERERIMFGIGQWEMLLIVLVIFILFGHRLPSVMRSLGRGVVEFKEGLAGTGKEEGGGDEKKDA